MVEKNLFDKNGRLKSAKKLSLMERGKDWWIQGYQLNVSYRKHWHFIKDKFEYYNMDFNKYSPIHTMQAYKIVKESDKLVQKYKNDPELRDISKKSPLQLRTLDYGKINNDKLMKGRFFLTNLRTLFQFCFERALRDYYSFIESGKAVPFFEEVMGIDGTIIDTEKDIEIAIKKAIRDVIKNEEVQV